MYAAAGGASLASRQARQKQRQTRKNENQKKLVAKAAPIVVPQPLKPPQSKQFHNLSPNYQASTLMLSRVERGALKPPQSTTRRHSSTLSTNNLKEPSKPRMRESPSMLIPLQNHLPKSQSQPKCQPLTPTTLVQNHIPFSPSFALPQIMVPESEPGKENERRCSLVRQCEEAEKCEVEPERNLLLDLRDVGPDGNPLLYAELDRNLYGSLEYPMSEVFWDLF